MNDITDQTRLNFVLCSPCGGNAAEPGHACPEGRAQAEAAAATVGEMMAGFIGNRRKDARMTQEAGARDAKAPEGYDASKYPPFAVTVDLAVFTIRNGVLSVLLIERKDDPFAGSWALPGGFVEPDEDAVTAAWRELAEETGVDRWSGHLEQLQTYSGPKRDPRMRVVSVAHVAFAPNLPEPVAGSDARQARWWAVEEVLGRCPACVNGFRPDIGGNLINFQGQTLGPCEDDCGFEGPSLAFDHVQILSDALERIRSKIEYTTLATEFVEEPFTIPELHRVYAAVWGDAPDLANFRRKVLKSPGFVTATEGRAESTSGPRPLLWRRGGATVLQPAMLRPDGSTSATDDD